jgi:hypothetical protein
MVAIPGFYDKAEDRARRFEVEDLASLKTYGIAFDSGAGGVNPPGH